MCSASQAASCAAPAAAPLTSLDAEPLQQLGALAMLQALHSAASPAQPGGGGPSGGGLPTRAYFPCPARSGCPRTLRRTRISCAPPACTPRRKSSWWPGQGTPAQWRSAQQGMGGGSAHQAPARTRSIRGAASGARRDRSSAGVGMPSAQEHLPDPLCCSSCWALTMQYRPSRSTGTRTGCRGGS